MAGRLEGKIALVTGGGSGIGRAAAQAFSREGAKVAVADIVPEGGEETVRMLHDSGYEAIFVRADVSRSPEVEAMVAQTVASFGHLDCAFNNAGVTGRARNLVADYSEEDWDRVMGVNLKGVWLCMKYEIPQMLNLGSGTIVNTASVAGLVGIRGSCAYTPSKHGVAGLTKVAALEYAEAGIRVNAVCPGYIDTPLLNHGIRSDPDLLAQVIQRHPVGRLGTAAEVAEAVVWLCSDAASFITGHTLTVDGGYLAQ